MKFADILLWTANSGGTQVFLGAPWVPLTIKLAPDTWRSQIALNWLAVSPHYFFRTPANRSLGRRSFLRSEWERIRISREVLVDHLVRPYLQPHFNVLDYGCGPGLLAVRSAKYVRHVIACDISRGVLECAKTLSGASNIQYLLVPRSGRLDVEAGSVDLVYCFAVFQHLEDAVVRGVLADFARVMKAGAKAVIHVVLSGTTGWKTEADWRMDQSIKGLAKWRFGLHCFSRTREEMMALVTDAGFSEVSFEPIQVPELMNDGVSDGSLLVFRKPV
jgi:ubiquinone/menaquinone biosynthesis C-methylase UbiE